MVNKEMEQHRYDRIIELCYVEMKAIYKIVDIIMIEWDISKSHAYRLIKMTKEEFGTYTRDLNTDMMQDTLNMLEEIRDKAIANGDLKEARECVKEIAKLTDLYTPQQIDINGEGIIINIIKPNGD